MKKVFVLPAKIFSLISVSLCLIFLLAACGGGGGGAAGASIPASEYTTHNPGGFAGGGSGGGNGGGGGGNPGGSVTLQGGTPLSVTSYSYKGQTYPDVTSLTNAMQAYGAPYNVTFTLAGGETRTARVSQTSEGFLIEHQYKATYTPPGGSGPQEVFYYKNDGISLTLPPVADDLYAEVNGVWYHANGYTVNGNSYPAGSTIPVAADSGDLDLGTIGTAPDTSSYGFRTADNVLVVNQTSGSIAINNAGGKTFEKVELPASAANGSISLDFSGVTGFSLIGDDGGGQGAGHSAISNGSKLGSVTLPDTNFQLGFGAFKDCPNITSLDLSHCTSLGIWALQNCSGLSTVDLSHCTTIGEYALEGCTSLTGNIDLSGYTGSTLKGVFKDCSGITGVTLPSAITQIDECTFLNCSNLSNIDLSHCTSIGNWAFQGCTGISGSIDLSSCSSIGTNAFTYCSGITGVTGLNGTIGDWAFYDTGLTGSIDMTNVNSVGDNAFQDCSQITSITGGLHGSIGESAFEGTGLTGLIDMSGVTSIGDYAFNNLSNISGTLNLSNCSQIGESAFQGCSGISGVTGLNGTIGDSAFRDTELSGSIDMANVTSVGSAAFAGCHIGGSLNLSNCTTIGPDAFAGCVGVTGITIGSSVTSIDAMAFYSCGACDYTFLKDPNSITYGAGSAIYGGATATWNDNGTNRTYTWNSGTKHWDPPQIGSKSAPTAVGDIVFSDGSATPYTDFNASNPISELQKQQAVAIIFNVVGTTKYGVGINESGDLQWAPDAQSSAFTTAFTSEEDDGSRVWEDIICVEDTDATNDPATNYPAFNYALTYTAPGYTSCWYLPAINELSALYNYRLTVNSAVSIIDNTYPIIDSNKNYWSSTQDDLYTNVRGIKDNTPDDILKLDTAKVRVICKFY